MKEIKQAAIADIVMDKIAHGDIRMRPRVYFSLLTVVSVVTVIFSALSIAYLSSMLFFWVRIQTANTMAWGARSNLDETLASFPWWAFFLALALLAVTALLIKRYGHMYRHRTVGIIFVLLATSLLLGFGFSALGIGSSHTRGQLPDYTEQRGPVWRR